MAATRQEVVHDIPLGQITIAEANVRDSDKDKGLADLVESIRRVGLLQPVVLVGTYGKPPYELIIGQRRYLAHRELGKPRIRAVFRKFADRFAALAASLAENLNRVAINHADAAAAVTDLYRHYRGKMKAVSEATGLTQHMITKYLYVERFATPRMKALLKRRLVATDDIKRAIRAAADDLKKAERLLELWAEQRLTRHEKKRAVEYGSRHAAASPEDIVAEAKIPRVDTSIPVPLSAEVRAALQFATQELQLTIEEVAGQAVEEWLQDRGFMGGAG